MVLTIILLLCLFSQVNAQFENVVIENVGGKAFNFTTRDFETIPTKKSIEKIGNYYIDEYYKIVDYNLNSEYKNYEINNNKIFYLYLNKEDFNLNYHVFKDGILIDYIPGSDREPYFNYRTNESITNIFEVYKAEIGNSDFVGYGYSFKRTKLDTNILIQSLIVLATSNESIDNYPYVAKVMAEYSFIHDLHDIFDEKLKNNPPYSRFLDEKLYKNMSNKINNYYYTLNYTKGGIEEFERDLQELKQLKPCYQKWYSLYIVLKSNNISNVKDAPEEIRDELTKFLEIRDKIEDNKTYILNYCQNDLERINQSIQPVLNPTPTPTEEPTATSTEATEEEVDETILLSLIIILVSLSGPVISMYNAVTGKISFISDLRLLVGKAGKLFDFITPAFASFLLGVLSKYLSFVEILVSILFIIIGFIIGILSINHIKNNNRQKDQRNKEENISEETENE